MDAFFFVPLLALTWIYSLFFSGLIAHFFLTIVESSGTMYAQNVDWSRRSFKALIRDGVDWPDASYIDWFWKGLYVLYIAGVWVGPAVILSRFILGPSVWVTVLTGLFFWLMFPIGVLSTMMSTSRWNIFWPPIFGCFAKRPLQTLTFYCFSFLPLALIFFMADLLIVHTTKTSFIGAVVLSPFAMLALFIYARLMGRLALALSFSINVEEEAEEAPKKRKRKRPVHAYDESTRWNMPTEAVDTVAADAQPSELAPLITPEGEVGGYDINYSDAPIPQEEAKPKQIIHHFDDEDDTPITVAPPMEVNNDERNKITEQLKTPPKHVMDLYQRDIPTEPTNPFGTATVSFLFDGKTGTMWLTGTVGLAALAILMRALDVLRPS